MTLPRSIPGPATFAVLLTLSLLATLSGCTKPQPYGVERQLSLPAGPDGTPARGQVWAVAPAVNLSGMREVDPLLQADLLFQKLQEVHGLTVVPVNRVVEVYASLKIEQVESAEQAGLACNLLGCDALVVPTVTAYDAYDPPKFGGRLQVFRKTGRPAKPLNGVKPETRESAAPAGAADVPALPQPPAPSFAQAAEMLDAANGSVREALWDYARGRHDPLGPMGQREYLQSMDRYVGFAYHQLIRDLLRSMAPAPGLPAAQGGRKCGPRDIPRRCIDRQESKAMTGGAGTTSQGVTG